MTLSAHCHCGRNAFEIDGELPEKLTRCTCSFCSKRGHLYAYYKPAQLKITEANSDGIYRWRSKNRSEPFLHCLRLRSLRRQSGLSTRRKLGRQNATHRSECEIIRRLRSCGLAGDGFGWEASLVI
jgi:hypothetical protein